VRLLQKSLHFIQWCTARETTSTDTSIPNSIKTYEILVYQTGLSEKSKKPVLTSKYVNFIVHDEGEAGEAAYYIANELSNEVNSDFTGDDSFISISKIFESPELRKRVRSAIMSAAQSIFVEAIPSSLLTGNANTGQPVVNVVNGSLFVPAQAVIIADSVASETNTIGSIATNALTMVNNLAHTYTTANDAYVSGANNDARRLWAANALLDPDKYTLAMMAFVATDATVQSSGNAVTDTVIQGIIDANVTKIATASNL
jgi:hypothetical protein